MSVEDEVERAIAQVKGKPLQDALRGQAASLSGPVEKTQFLGAVQQIKANQGGLGWLHMVIAIVGLLAFFWLLWHLTDGAFFTEIGPGRPVLMLIVVFATTIYGGMLMNAALFGTDQAGIEGRFQRAREIFLVFSGICGTVVGFYFGAGTDEPGSTAPEVEASTALGGEDGGAGREAEVGAPAPAPVP